MLELAACCGCPSVPLTGAGKQLPHRDSAIHWLEGKRTMAMFITIARTDELPPRQGKLVEVNQKRIALFNVAGCYYALDDMCPPRGGPLSEGQFERVTVACPWHGSVFDLATGNLTRPPVAAGVAMYDVRLDGEEIVPAV